MNQAEEKTASGENSLFLQNLILKRKEILLSASAFAAGIAILIGYFYSGPKATSYASAERVFANWEASPQNEELYREMKAAFAKLPALEKKYEAVIAQKLLGSDKREEGLALADRSLERVKGEIPFHTSYAATSLLIEKGGYQEALERAVALKAEMEGASLFKKDSLGGGSLLYIHNLIRIACLQQELRNGPGERAAWEELESCLATGGQLSELVLASFSDQNLNLAQYIAERKKQL